jgi:hypothetical protein
MLISDYRLLPSLVSEMKGAERQVEKFTESKQPRLARLSKTWRDAYLRMITGCLQEVVARRHPGIAFPFISDEQTVEILNGLERSQLQDDMLVYLVVKRVVHLDRFI